MEQVLGQLVSSALFKLFIGVLLAAAVRLYSKRNGAPQHQDMVDEARTLLIPAVLVGAGFLATGGQWAEALEAFLLSLAVPLGMNSQGKERRDE